MKRNNSTEFVGYSVNNIYNRNGTQTPLDTKSDFSSIFQDVLYELFFRLSLFNKNTNFLNPGSLTRAYLAAMIQVTGLHKQHTIKNRKTDA